MPKISGQAPFAFSLCEDLYSVPEKARACEVNLHGGFAVDPDTRYVYYGMPGCGLMRIAPHLRSQEIIELPSDLKPINFHSTAFMYFDGKRRLVLPANNDAKVVVVGLDGNVDYVLERPEFDEYRDAQTPFNPTDAAFSQGTLYVADGYGANYISTVDPRLKTWQRTFGGKTDDPEAKGLFGTAHGLAAHPNEMHLTIADRPHARFQHFSHHGHFRSMHGLPPGSKPCGISFMRSGTRWYALVGSLDDPQEGRPAPLYILDAMTYEVLSTVRPKEELGVELADHIHNAVWYRHHGHVYLICQAWNPGHYFVLVQEG